MSGTQSPRRQGTGCHGRCTSSKKLFRRAGSYIGVGDELIAAGQAQRRYDEQGLASVIVDQRNRPRWHPIWEGNPAILHPDAVDATALSRIVNAGNARPYIVYPFTEMTGWTFNRDFKCREHVAKIYLTDEELKHGRQIAAAHPRYVVIEPWSKHANLRWPREHWAALVASRPDIFWVQHVHRDSDRSFDGQGCRIPGVHLYVETPSFRDACGLVASSACYIRGESGMAHAAAALGVNQITIWGGCMDWDVMGGYARQVGVGIVKPCCGSYLPCAHCAEIMQGISPTLVASTLDAVLAVA